MPNNNFPLLILPSDRPNLVWIEKVYMGPSSTPEQNLIVNKGDLILDIPRMRFYTVSHVNNNVPTLKLFDVVAGSPGSIGSDLMHSLSNYNPDVSTSAFYNPNVTPKTIVLDSDYYLTGTDHSYGILYRGRLTAEQTQFAEELSRNLANTSSQIPIDAVGTNPGIRRPQTIYTNKNVNTGDEVTFISYTNATGISGIKHFTVVSTDAVRAPDINQDYIVDVLLVSPMVTNDHPTTIQLPSNISVNSTGFQARLLYHSGNYSPLMNIDGTKIKLLGLDDFNTSYGGPASQASLVYYPDPDEPCINMGNSGNPFIMRTYDIVTVLANTDYSFKIYLVPKWDAINNKYIPEYWLTNFNHEFATNLTEMGVTVNAQKEGGGSVDWSLPNTEMTIDLSINIKDVFPALDHYIFTQRLKVRLEPPMSNLVTNRPWQINYLGSETMNIFGNRDNLKFFGSYVGGKNLDISAGATTRAEWLDRLYVSLSPVWDTEMDEHMPMPTDFVLVWEENGPGTAMFTSSRMSVDDWNVPVSRVDEMTAQSVIGDWTGTLPVRIVWLYQRPGDVGGYYRHLGVSPVMVHMV